MELMVVFDRMFWGGEDRYGYKEEENILIFYLTHEMQRNMDSKNTGQPYLQKKQKAVLKCMEEVMQCVLPCQQSEVQRKKQVLFFQALIQESLGCKSATVGSYALKTYLPDGDIDITLLVPPSTVAHIEYITTI